MCYHCCKKFVRWIKFYNLLVFLRNTGNSKTNLPETKPFATSPRSVIHPHQTKIRTEKGGSEGRTKNPQSRSQSYLPDNSPPKSSRIGNNGKYSTGGNKVRVYGFNRECLCSTVKMFSTVEDVQYNEGCSVLWGMFNTVEDVQYYGQSSGL